MEVNKKKFMNGITRVIYGVMPFFAAAVMIFLPYVGIGGSLSFGVNSIVSSVLTAGLLLMFYFPAKSLFKDMFMNTKRIHKKSTEYAVLATVGYNHLRDLDKFSDIEYERRKKRYINNNLQLVTFGYDEFVARYKFEPKLIKKDINLSTRQKRSLLKIAYTLHKIKRQDYEKVLPGSEFGTQFKRVHSSMERSSRINSGSKIVKSSILAFATVSIVLTSNLDGNWIEILLAFLIRLGCGLWQTFSALISSSNLVNRRYFSELSEKNLYLNEFVEEFNLQSERDNITKNLKDDESIVVMVQAPAAQKPEADDERTN